MHKIYVWFAISSETLTIEDISEVVGYAPDSSWRKGDQRRGSGKIHEKNCWAIETHNAADRSELVADAMHNSLRTVLRRLRPASQRIKELSMNHEVALGIGLTVAEVPEFLLSRDEIEGIASLGASLDIDLVLSEPNAVN